MSEAYAAHKRLTHDAAEALIEARRWDSALEIIREASKAAQAVA